MSFPRYERYKHSGVEWLGEVPEHWELCKLQHIAQLNPARSELRQLKRDTVVSFFPMEALDTNGPPSLDVQRAMSEVETGYTYFRDGDVAFAKVTPCFENGKRAHFNNLVNGIGFGTTELIVLRAKLERSSSSFLYWFVAATHFLQLGEGAMYGAGGLKRVPEIFVSQFPLHTPPLEEQTFIVEFLEAETSKIDALIEEQRRLIELLKEKRQAVISHAVAKGLNPDAPGVCSHTEEMQGVPTHWKIMRVRNVSLFTTSGPRGWSERLHESGSVFVQSGDLDDKLQIDFANCKRVTVEEGAEASRTRLANGDIVVCITGAKTGNLAVCVGLGEPAYVNQHLCLIRLDGSVLPRFLGLLLKSSIGQTYFDKSQYGMKQGLSLEDVREAPLLVPPLPEQQEILDFLDSDGMRFDELCVSSHAATRLLKERRAALISAAVTGKIDVRNYTPKEAYEPA